MTVREQILSSPETISDLAWAAERRYREGQALFDGRHFIGAVYLLGLASEMWLKIACFRFRGGTPSTIVSSMLSPARTWMSIRAPAIASENYHSLAFWATYIVELRQHAASPLSGEFVGRLRHHVMNRLFQDWKLELRYRSIPVDERACLRVLQDASWLRSVYDRLWR